MGPDSFTYEISDGNGGTATATVTIDVGGINDAPEANPDTNSTTEDVVLNVSDVANGVIRNPAGEDTDLDGDTLSVSEVSFGATAGTVGSVLAGDWGNLTLRANGTYTYAPNAAAQGLDDGESQSDVFTYTVTDPGGLTATTTLTITVTGVNDAPDAVDDLRTTPEDTPVIIAVLGNDTDVDGEPLTVTQIAGQPVLPGDEVTVPNGTATLNPDGTITFTPEPQFNGTVDFTYTISDGTTSDTANVRVVVDDVNDPPVAQDNVVNGFEDTVLNFDPRSNDTDPEDDPLTITEINGQPVTPGSEVTLPEGVITVKPDGTLSFTPNPEFNGNGVQFDYTISDRPAGDPNGLTDTGTVTINIAPVNDLPIATDNVKTTAQDTTVEGNVITANTGAGVDSDIDGDTLTVSGYTVGGVAGVVGVAQDIPGEGTLTINEDGSYTFDPLPAFTGPVKEVEYTISDGNGGTASAKLNITVEPLTETPSVVDDVQTTPENTPVQIDVLGNDDPGSEGPLAITEVNGQPITVTDPVAITDPVTGLPVGTVSLIDGGTPDDPTDDKLEFTPEPGYNGPATFTYTVEDKEGNPLQATVTVDVTPVNEPPVAEDDTTVTPQDTPVSIDVLGNDSDPDGDPLKITEVNGQPIAVGTPVAITDPVTGDPVGVVTLDNGGTPDDLTDDQLVFTPEPGYNGPATFTYTVEDAEGVPATGNVTVKVGEDNLAPVAQPDVNATDENTPLTVTAADGVIQSGTTPGGVDSDPNGDSLSVSAINGAAADVGKPVQGTYGTVVLNANGSYTYTPTAGAQALKAGDEVTDVFNYTVTDPSGQTASTTLTITVTGVNDAPVAADNNVLAPRDTTVGGNLLTDDDNGAGVPGGVDSDPDGDPLTVSGFEVNGVPGALDVPLTIDNVGVLTVSGNGDYSFEPEPGFEGAVPAITYTIDDGQGGTDTANLNILVDAVNDPPVAKPDGVTSEEDKPVTFNPLTNDSDPEGQPLKITEINGEPITAGTPVEINDPVTGDKVGDLVLNQDGTLTFTPVKDYNNTTPLPIEYTVADPEGLTATATINVTVKPVNDPPVPNDPTDPTFDPTTGNYSATTPQDTPVSGTVVATDLDGDTLTYSKGNDPANGSVSVNPDGSWTYTPNPGYSGADSFTVVVDDGNGGTAISVISIGVTPVAAPPVPAPPPAPVPAPPPEESNPPAFQPAAPAPSPVSPPVALPEAVVHVLVAVGEASTERSLGASPLAPAQLSSPLFAEASGRTPDSLMFMNVDPYRDLQPIREPGRGEVITMRPALHVQYAVRHQPVTSEHGLYVQHAVRASQLDSQLADASLRSQNSASPGYSTLLDPFALGAPGFEAWGVKLASADEAQTADKPAEAVAAKAVPAEPVPTMEKAIEVPTKAAVNEHVPTKRSAAGFRSQLEHMAKDRSQGARPITRAIAVKI